MNLQVTSPTPTSNSTKFTATPSKTRLFEPGDKVTISTVFAVLGLTYQLMLVAMFLLPHSFWAATETVNSDSLGYLLSGLYLFGPLSLLFPIPSFLSLLITRETAKNYPETPNLLMAKVLAIIGIATSWLLLLTALIGYVAFLAK